MRGQERELILLRSENGETWKEHVYDCKTENLSQLLNGMDEGEAHVIFSHMNGIIHAHTALLMHKLKWVKTDVSDVYHVWSTFYNINTSL